MKPNARTKPNTHIEPHAYIKPRTCITRPTVSILRPLLLRPLALAIILLLLFSITTATPALAACSLPAGNAGDTIYNKPYHVYQYCDGTKWWEMGPQIPPPASTFAELTSIADTSPKSVWGDGTYIYVVGSTTISAYTFNGAAFTLAGSYTTLPAAANAVWGHGGYIYVADGASGILAFTFNGTTFTLAGSYSTSITANAVWGDGTYIYVADTGGYVKAFTFNGTTFTLAGTYTDTGYSPLSVWGDGTYIYVADGTSILAFTFNGTTFTLRGSNNTYHASPAAHFVWGDGTYIYLADQTTGFYAFTFNGTTFTLVGSNVVTGQYNSIWGDGTYIYVADSGYGFYAYTFNGTTFTQVGSYSTASTFNSVWGDGTYIYGANVSVPAANYAFKWVASGGSGCGSTSNTVFVTSTAYNGNLGGVAGANADCAAVASAGGLSGTYKAWVAVTTGTDDPATTFTQSTIPYKEVGGTVIASNWAGLTSGTLTNAITLNESGVSVGAGSVHTNVATNGTAYTSGSSATGNCLGFTTNSVSDQGNYGSTPSTTSTWTYGGSAVCTANYHLYCFRQDGGAPVGSEGDLMYNSAQHVPQFCNGTNWIAMGPQGVGGGGGCSAASRPVPSYAAQSNGTACAVASGDLYCWGQNGDGEAGLGNTSQYTTPQQVGSLMNWTAISQGDANYDPSACGIAGGNLYCWGHNQYGEAGLGNTTQYTTPQQVTSPSTTWSAVSVGGYDACGITTAGNLYCWGQNASGEDGVGNTTQHTTPQQVGSDTTWTAISTRASSTCGIDAGKLYCWGQTIYGEFGLNQYSTPQLVNSDTTWTAISQGLTDNCGIDAGKLYCWGSNGNNGVLGLGNTTAYPTPQQVGTDTTWTAVSTNDDNGSDPGTCGIDAGKIYCWGENQYGELGLGNTTQYTTPQQVGTDTTWTAVSFGGYDTCGVDNGWLYCWGNNHWGEDGQGNGTQYTTPQLVSIATTATSSPEGSMFYNSDKGVMQYCNGTNWMKIGSHSQ